jgi:glycosyltransferase involved in cell wall biosynthesis
MKNNPLISVVIPAYNRQNTISYCLDSVLAQTYKNLEVIVVDDCSTDSTVSIVRSHPDPRVRCIVLEKNAGAQRARNKGILESKADWIAFQDSDDEWLQDKLEKQVSVLADADYDPCSFVYCNAYCFDKARGIKTVRLLPVVEGENQYSTLLKAPAPLYPTMIASKKALEKIGYLDEQVPSFQEWDTSIRLAKYCRITHLKEPLMVYHVGNNDAISGSATKHIEGWHYIISKYESDIKDLCGEEAWLKLNVQLLSRCLNLGLVAYYDRYRCKVGMSREYRFQMFYLMFCRKYGMRPENIFYRLVRKLFGSSDFFAAGQGRIIKQV